MKGIISWGGVISDRDRGSECECESACVFVYAREIERDINREVIILLLVLSALSSNKIFANAIIKFGLIYPHHL